MLPHTSASASSAHKPPSTKDIPPVTLTNIPHVEPAAFKTYLTQIGNLYDAFQRAKAESEGESAQAQRRDSGRREESSETIPGSAATTPRLSSSTFSPAGTPQPKRRTSGSKRGAPAVTPLSTIPSVYFDEDFHLENPRTFDIVSERSEVVRPLPPKGGNDTMVGNGSLEPPQPSGRKALATNAILQEKLSWYMDTVEVHLISSISTASKSFFAALGSLRELHSEASDSVAEIKSVREDLKRLDEQMAIGGLKVVEMKRRRENLRKLTDATDQLNAIVAGLSSCDDVVDQGDLDEAMGRIGVVERLISGTLDTSDPSMTSWIGARLPPIVVDLRSLRALDGVSEGIRQIKFRIGQGFEARFLETLLGDLRQHVKSVPNRDTLERWVMASQRARGEHNKPKSVLPAYLETSQTFRHDLRASLIGLSGSDFTMQASAAFRDQIVREMKRLVRQYMPSSNDDDAESMTSVSTRSGQGRDSQQKNMILARNIRAMDSGDAEEFFVNIFTDIGEALRRLSVQTKVLLDVTSGVSTPPPSGGGLRSPPPNLGSIDGYLGVEGHQPNVNGLQQELMQAMDMSSLLGQAVDAAQVQVVRLLKVRAEATTSFPLDRFLRYFNLCRLFADECEAVSGRSGSALKTVVNDHIKVFVAKFGDFEKQQLAQAMDSDRWVVKDFDEADTVVLARVLRGMETDPAEWQQAGNPLQKLDDNAPQTATETNGDVVENTKNPVPAIVDGERYFLSKSSVFVLSGIDRYLNLISAIPSMTAEVSASLCEYLKLFNSRLCQLILGAGAIHSAGLKNINTKHLAIASQALSFLIALLPYVRECARRHSPSTSVPKPAFSEFENVKRLLYDQQSNIHDKLIDILSNRARSHVARLKDIRWDDAAEVERDISPNLDTLIKETTIMHKVIRRYLSEGSVRGIMGSVFESYKEQLGKVFKEAGVRTGRGKERYVNLFDSAIRCGRLW